MILTTVLQGRYYDDHHFTDVKGEAYKNCLLLEIAQPKHESILTSEPAFLTMMQRMTGEQSSKYQILPTKWSDGRVEIAHTLKLISLVWLLVLLPIICVIRFCFISMNPNGLPYKVERDNTHIRGMF